MRNFFIFISVYIGICYGAEVLILPSSIFPVHRFTMRHLAEELIRRGHTITWFEYGLKKPDIPLPNGVKETYLTIETPNRLLRDLYEFRNHSHHDHLWEDGYWDEAQQTSAWLASTELCDRLLGDKTHRAEFNKLVSKKFDAVVVDDLYNPCGLLHAGLQKSVFVYWSMTGLRTESAWANQSPSPPSYIPVAGTGLTDELNFWQRSYNMAAYLRALYVHQHIVLRRLDAIFQGRIFGIYKNGMESSFKQHMNWITKNGTTIVLKHFPGQVTEAFYIERNASINFVNHPPIFDFARPYMPRVNFVGALHCKKPEKLPPVFSKFVDEADNEKGFILITTGFSMQWKRAPKELINNFLEAFRAKPDVRFVWQYDGEPIKNKPENVLISSWLPQQDLLGHSKCKGHISHGGLNSVIESVWHGVPVIGWPLTIAGYDNLLRVTARNSGFMLEKKVPSKTELISAINRIYIRHYKEEMLIFQDMVTDVPYTELNHSAFWVEFIIRHQEVPHARSGADHLNIIQYFLIDVIAFIISVLILLVVAIYYILKLFFRIVCYLLCLPLSLLRRSSKVNHNKPQAKDEEKISNDSPKKKKDDPKTASLAKKKK